MSKSLTDKKQLFDSERPVGLLERYSVARHNAAFYLNFVVGVRYACSVSGEARTASLERAIAVCLAEHAFLSAVLVGEETDRPSWALLSSVEPGSVLRWRQPAESLETVLAEVHSHRFQTEDKRVPLWRCDIVPQDAAVTVLLIAHHGIADGNSLRTVHLTLQQALNDPAATAISRRALPRPIEQICHCRPGFLLLLKTILVVLIFPLWVSKLLGIRTPVYNGRTILPNGEHAHPTAVRLFEIEPILFERILAFTRSVDIKLSLTACLCACMGSAVRQTLSGSPSTILCAIAADQRLALPEDVKHAVVANYSAGFKFNLPSWCSVHPEPPALILSRRDLISLSKVINANIRRAMQSDEMGQAIGLLAHIPHKEPGRDSIYRYDTGWEQMLRSNAKGGQRNATFAVSNLGLWPNENSSSSLWRAESALMSQCVGAISELVNLSMVTCGKRMTCVLTWQQETLNPGQVDKLQRHLMESLASLCEYA